MVKLGKERAVDVINERIKSGNMSDTFIAKEGGKKYISEIMSVGKVLLTCTRKSGKGVWKKDIPIMCPTCKEEFGGSHLPVVLDAKGYEISMKEAKG